MFLRLQKTSCVVQVHSPVICTSYRPCRFDLHPTSQLPCCHVRLSPWTAEAFNSTSTSTSTSTLTQHTVDTCKCTQTQTYTIIDIHFTCMCQTSLHMRMHEHMQAASQTHTQTPHECTGTPRTDTCPRKRTPKHIGRDKLWTSHTRIAPNTVFRSTENKKKDLPCPPTNLVLPTNEPTNGLGCSRPPHKLQERSQQDVNRNNHNDVVPQVQNIDTWVADNVVLSSCSCCVCVLWRVAACCGVLRCVVVCCGVLRCVMVCCGVLWWWLWFRR